MPVKTRPHQQGIKINHVTPEELVAIIREHENDQVLINARSSQLRRNTPTWKVGSLGYWDGTIINPNRTHFSFGYISRDGGEVTELRYDQVRGLLLPVKLFGTFINAENYVLRN